MNLGQILWWFILVAGVAIGLWGAIVTHDAYQLSLGIFLLVVCLIVRTIAPVMLEGKRRDKADFVSFCPNMVIGSHIVQNGQP
jgi:hypothetical protein